MKDVMDIIGGGAFTTGSSGFIEFYALTGMALVASSAILAFLYVWSALFRNQNMSAYVKMELFELAVSAIIAIMAITLVGALSGIEMTSILPDTYRPDTDYLPAGESLNIYSMTQAYFDQVGKDMGDWLQMNYVLNVVVDMYASVTPYARPLGVGLVASPITGLVSPLKSLLYNMTVGLSVAYIINYAQKYTFLFFIGAFLKYYMPLGVFLRCFTPTRRIGGALIGIGFTFLFIYPMLCVLSFSMFYATDGPMYSVSDVLLEHVLGGASDMVVGLENYGDALKSGSLTDIVSGTFGGIGSMINGVVGTTFLSIMMLPLAIIGRAFAIGFVIPAFNTLIFVHAGKYLSKSMGEEVDLTALTRLI